MLTKAHATKGFHIPASDGSIGTVSDLMFDDAIPDRGGRHAQGLQTIDKPLLARADQRQDAGFGSRPDHLVCKSPTWISTGPAPTCKGHSRPVGNQTRQARVEWHHGPDPKEPDMPLNASLQRQKPRPPLNPDAVLARAFQTVLAEDLPARFHLLLDALGPEGSDHDHNACHPDPSPGRKSDPSAEG